MSNFAAGVYEEKIRMSTGFGRNINFIIKSNMLMTLLALLVLSESLIPLR